MHCTASWPPVAPTIERMTTHLSMRAAISGKVSPMRMPGTFVSIGLNSPRISGGASVLMSHMSWWDGPPPRKTLMTALCRLGAATPRASAAASARRMSARVRFMAPKVRAPTRRKPRRETPSHSRVLGPKRVSMGVALAVGGGPTGRPPGGTGRASPPWQRSRSRVSLTVSRAVCRVKRGPAALRRSPRFTRRSWHRRPACAGLSGYAQGRRLGGSGPGPCRPPGPAPGGRSLSRVRLPVRSSVEEHEPEARARKRKPSLALRAGGLRTTPPCPRRCAAAGRGRSVRCCPAGPPGGVRRCAASSRPRAASG